MLAPIFIENFILVKKFHFHFNEMSLEKNLTSYKWFATNRIFRLRYRISTLAFSQSRFKTEDGRKDLTVTYTPAGFFSFRLWTASSFPSDCTKMITTHRSRNSRETIAAVLSHNFIPIN